MSMSRRETAVLSCPRQYACGGTLLPAPPDEADRVEFEVHLLSLIQVRCAAGACTFLQFACGASGSLLPVALLVSAWTALPSWAVHIVPIVTA